MRGAGRVVFAATLLLLVGFVNIAWDGGDHAFLIDTKTFKSREINAFQQVPKPGLKLLGDLAEGATFSYDGRDFKKLGGRELVKCKSIGVGRPLEVTLPYWAIVKV